MIKKITMLLFALVVGYAGVTLARYAEADDAPGGVVIGWVLVMGAVALGARSFLRREPQDPGTGPGTGLGSGV